MKGYLQCLIDQYKRKFDKAIGNDKSIYRDIFTDLVKFQQYIEKPERKVVVDDTPKKYMLTGFKGDISGFIDFLKKLNLEKDDIK